MTVLRHRGAPHIQSSDDQLANWIERELERTVSSDESVAAFENALELGPWLRRDERAALLRAFDDSGPDRWRPLTDCLRSSPSVRLIEVVAELIEHNGFQPAARLRSTDVQRAREQRRVADFRDMIAKLLGTNYPEHKSVTLSRRATAVAAILIGRRKATVSKAMQATKDLRRGALARVRIAVEDDPTSEQIG